MDMWNKEGVGIYCRNKGQVGVSLDEKGKGRGRSPWNKDSRGRGLGTVDSGRGRIPWNKDPTDRGAWVIHPPFSFLPENKKFSLHLPFIKKYRDMGLQYFLKNGVQTGVYKYTKII